MALTLVLVSFLVLNRLDDYFYQQQRVDLRTRAETVARYAVSLAVDKTANLRPVVGPTNLVDPAAVAALETPGQQRILADSLGQADVAIRFGGGTCRGWVPSPNGEFDAELRAEPAQGQTREDIRTDPVCYEVGSAFFPYVIEVTLSHPYTFRATAVANVAGLLVAIGLFALGLSMIVAAGLARRFTTPLRRLTEATSGLAEGDLSRRVPPSQVRGGSSELTELAVQFNAMAERLQESVETIRRDRDRSRDFLADVSHELRTPIAALRTFNELLKDQAGHDPAAREEFLEASGQQIDRLDWLAQNLLELSKLDSGLVLLDLRPDDLRATVESAVEQAGAAARKRGLTLTLAEPDAPIRILHDPPRIGQVVTNLVGNAIKFTPRGGSVAVAVRPHPEGGEIEVRDTGVGIDAEELPKVFDRFYRGARVNEARGSGSGLGLSIVRSIVDMHGGRVAVESRLGAGSRFTVVLPRDPKTAPGSPRPAAVAAVASEAAAGPRSVEPATTAPTVTAPAGTAPATVSPIGPVQVRTKVADSSPPDGPRLNPDPSP